MAVVTPVGSLGRSGLADFVLQRASAVVLALYGLWLLGVFLAAPMDYARFSAVFEAWPMRVFTTLAVVALAVHGWIGMWTIGTDYIRPHHVGRGHAVYLALYQLLCLAGIFAYVLWPLAVVWGLR